MKALIGVLALALAGVTGALLWQLARPTATTLPAKLATPVVVAAAPPSQPRVPEVRKEIAQAVDMQVLPLQTEREVDRYLEDLTARAYRQRKVTALEVEPGLVAIRQLSMRIGPERADEKLVAFTQRMVTLSAEFDGRSPPRPPAN